MIHGKVWGTTEDVFTDGDTVAAHLLHVQRGGYCSEHQHAHKANLFHVLSGRLEIERWPGGSGEGARPDVTVLGPGQSTAVETGVWHRFRAAEDTVCLEICHGALVGDDIQRRSQGGVS